MARVTNLIRRSIRQSVAIVLLVICLAFASGFLVREWQLPPSEQLSALATRLRQSRMAFSLGLLWYRVRVRLQPGRPPGAWVPARDLTDRNATDTLTADQRRSVARLLTLGYLGGYEAASGRASVTRFVPEAAFEGLNLYISGHAPEAVLMDMKGQVLHHWSYAFRKAFPDAEEFPEDRTGTGYWRRVHLFPNGDLLAIHDDYGIVKLDKDSRLLWATSGRFHHDLFVGEDGLIYTLGRKVQFLTRIHPYEPVLVDSIEILDANGVPRRSVPLLEAFEKSSYASFLKHAPPFGDILHTNTIELLDGRLERRSPAFRKGNVLVSMRELDVIAVVDLATEAVVWALSGQWRHQHQPTVLDNGNILLFDNLGNGGMSRVLELDPLTQQILWAYAGSEQEPFSTLISGSGQRLPNGNTLITESDTGRAFEVDPGGRIVWEFHNNARLGERNELVAQLLEVSRFSKDVASEWLDRRSR